MIIAECCEAGPDQGKWYMVLRAPQTAARRAGYCASRCSGHGTREEAQDHYLQYQLDRESAMHLERAGELPCEICTEPTTLRARLGQGGKLFILCRRHQTTANLQRAWRSRAAPAAS